MARSRRTGAASPPRRTASTSARAAPAPSKPAAPAAKPAAPAPAPAPAAAKPAAPAPSAAAPAQHAPAPAAAPTAAPPAAPAPSQGPGMMAQIAANATSTALGVAAGRAIDRTFFGGGSAPAAEGDTQDAEEAAPQQYASAGAPKAANGGACSFESSEFSKCLETSDASACQWYFDLLSQCQQNAKENAQYAQH